MTKGVVASGGVVVRAIDCEPGDPGSIPSRTRDTSEHAPRRCALGKGTLHEFPHSTQQSHVICEVQIIDYNSRMTSTLSAFNRQSNEDFVPIQNPKHGVLLTLPQSFITKNALRNTAVQIRGQKCVRKKTRQDRYNFKTS
ncbi:hypothetical protein Bbelb_276630 [Branchiostoma belcheri]|nr:hypothetical protein Bbelb_276630 [Branchiostoma belcheri]